MARRASASCSSSGRRRSRSVINSRFEAIWQSYQKFLSAGSSMETVVILNFKWLSSASLWKPSIVWWAERWGEIRVCKDSWWQMLYFLQLLILQEKILYNSSLLTMLFMKVTVANQEATWLSACCGFSIDYLGRKSLVHKSTTRKIQSIIGFPMQRNLNDTQFCCLLSWRANHKLPTVNWKVIYHGVAIASSQSENRISTQESKS